MESFFLLGKQLMNIEISFYDDKETPKSNNFLHFLSIPFYKLFLAPFSLNSFFIDLIPQ